MNRHQNNLKANDTTTIRRQKKNKNLRKKKDKIGF